LYVVINLIMGGIKEGTIWRDRMIAMLIIFLFNIAFWACFEQAGTSLTLFARRNVDRMIGGWEMADTFTQFFNPLFIILFGSVFSIMWVKLSKAGKNPNIPTKFGLGIIQLGLGYLLVMVGGMFLSAEYLIPLFILAFLYLLHTTGELFLSPIGLSMVTKLAPKHMTGAAMGGWFLSFAFSNYAAGILATFTGVGGHGGGHDGPKPTFTQIVQEIGATAGKINENEKALVMTAADLASKGNVTSEDELAKKYPAEIQKLAGVIGDNFRTIQSELYPVISDTAAYKGTKKLNWPVIVNTYKDGVEGMNKGIEALNNAAKALAGGTKYEEVKDKLGEGVVGIGDGFAALEKTAGQLSKEGTGMKFDGTEKAVAQFEQGYGTIASHVYWGIYSRVYTLMGLITVGIGILLVLINKPVNKLMHGVA
jgi:hypothetical protein